MLAAATVATTRAMMAMVRRRLMGGPVRDGRVRTAGGPSSEPVADAPHGGEREVGAELLAQLADVDVDRPLVAEPVRAPDAVEELLAGQGQALVGHQERQQVELPGGQRDH